MLAVAVSVIDPVDTVSLPVCRNPHIPFLGAVVVAILNIHYTKLGDTCSMWSFRHIVENNNCRTVSANQRSVSYLLTVDMSFFYRI